MRNGIPNLHSQPHLPLDGDCPQVNVQFAGASYEIKKDIRTDVSYPHPPSWYVQRLTDYRVSKRYYSQPQGAFTALVTGAIQWVD